MHPSKIHVYMQMVNLYIDPQGEKLFEGARTENMSQANLSHPNLSKDNELTFSDSKETTIESLNAKVKELQTQLAMCKVCLT